MSGFFKHIYRHARRGAAEVPWWAALVLAPLVYGVLDAAPHLFHVETPFFAGVDALVRTLPQAAPYAGVALLLMAALNGAAEWQRARKRRSGVAHLLHLPQPEVELLVAEGFRHQSYVVENTAAGPRLRKDGRVYVLNTTLWRNDVVGMGPVRDVHQTATTEMADGAVLVTVGTFTADAQAFALLHHVTLLNGDDVVKLVNDIHVEV